MIGCGILGALATISFGLTLWQWIEARRFPLHRRPPPTPRPLPGLSVLKPLKGADEETEGCLRSWLAQDYDGSLQFLFGVTSPEDPAAAVIERLLHEFPKCNARLVVCPQRLGVNAKVSKLAQLEPLADQDFIVVSDADVRVPPDFLTHLMTEFARPGVALVNPFYAAATPHNAAMRWEAVAVNADFWSSVLMSRRLAPMRFALGAVMALRRADLESIGGFAALANHLADDYELGRRLTARGGEVALCPTVVECREAPQSWAAVWRHQLRWSRTIRVCQPAAYAASIISNATLWPLLWLAACPGFVPVSALGVCLVARLATAFDNQRRLTRSCSHWRWFWLPPVKDLLQVALWVLAFTGHTVEWRGERYRVRRNGELTLLPR
ncbi:MAG: bacteriohopanetetrol glucosamine biosynthesis glycosyltransferase HpnI [Verrucomicrobia bacterium]|nr:bacteriohopanetetrol glucosamine biosynthesis glycosyltransferase HpnI [Verrucomicrobiota bacterium]